ncbi:MAG: DUF1854 domain-containing protein [Elusimicrobiota bacterium]
MTEDMDRYTQYIIDPAKVKFYRNANDTGGLAMELIGSDGIKEVYPIIRPVRVFPITAPEEYISICDKGNKEIGILQKLSVLSADQQKLIRHELWLRYVMPVVTEIVDIEKGPNAFRWEIITNRGKKVLYVKERNEQLTFIGRFRIIINDVENCRYDITDYRKLSKHSLLELEKVI